MTPRPRKPVGRQAVPNARKAKETSSTDAKAYTHPESESPARPAAGAQARFKKKKEPKTYRYDSSLAPELQWDGGNASARDRAESLLAAIRASASLEEAKEAAAELAALSKSFLNWSGKAEHLSFDVPTLPLFVHERLSTEAVLNSVRDKQIDQQINLFGDAQRSVADHVLKAYEHQDPWANRMILGDSLVVMNSLLEYEGMGGKVQMIYIDPPYGVQYNSNFQPFVGKPTVTHNDDKDLTREPEMVQAYRDTWELGLHSYLTYLRDRLRLSRELLSSSGSVFVQISAENLHHVREICDEIFGASNSCGLISFKKTVGQTSDLLAQSYDFLLWYSRDRTTIRFKPIFRERSPEEIAGAYPMVENQDGVARRAQEGELLGERERRFNASDLSSQTGSEESRKPFPFHGRTYTPRGQGRGWSTNTAGLERLQAAGRLIAIGNTLCFKRYESDFPLVRLTTTWEDTIQSTFSSKRVYVVQTAAQVIERCVLMTTEPGDLVLDPTCGSGSTAFAAEKWGRRWITVDTSRVPLALARQRLLTSTFSWYALRDAVRGPSGGFDFRRRVTTAGIEVGGLVPHIRLGSIANNENAKEEQIADRPEVEKGIVRVAGPFTVEATIPTPVDIDGDGIEDSHAAPDHGDWVERVITILRRSPTLHLGGNRTAHLELLRPPARTLALSAEATVEGKLVAIVVGPEHGSVSEKQVSEAGREAYQKGYSQLLVIGLAIEPNARALVEQGEATMGIPSTYVQATPDLLMGDLLKTMRSSQIFSVCGLPDVAVDRVPSKEKGAAPRFEVTLRGLDIFDPVTMEVEASPGERVPCWMLDQDHDSMVFRASQVFFPRTEAWNALQRALKADFDPSVWEHLAGTTSTPFSAPAGKATFTIAVKVIDPRGNELLVTREVTA